MRVNIAQVRREKKGTARYELTEDFSSRFQFVAEDLSFNSPVHVQLLVINTGKSLLVNGSIRTELKVACGRCLEEFIYPLDLPYEDEWVLSSQATEEQIENALLFDKDEIDIGERIFEQIVLALPMRFLCSPECQGLCPVCGTNRNLVKCNCEAEQVDPRLAVLAQWSRS